MNEISGLLGALGTIVGAVGGVVVAVLAIQRWKEANRQRRDELSWRQAEEGRKVLDDLLLSEKHGGYDALVMTDLPEKGQFPFEDRNFSPPKPYNISHNDIIGALAGPAGSEKAAFIQACFDDLFYYLDRIGYFLMRGILTPDDVKCPLDYYAEKMARQRALYEGYIRRTRADRALQLLQRLLSWKRGADVPAE